MGAREICDEKMRGRDWIINGAEKQAGMIEEP